MPSKVVAARVSPEMREFLDFLIQKDFLIPDDTTPADLLKEALTYWIKERKRGWLAQFEKDVPEIKLNLF